MEVCHLVLGIIVLIFAVVLHSLYVPMPPGTKLAARLGLSAMRAMDRVGTVLEWAGITDRLVVLKYMTSSKFKPKPIEALLYAEVQSEDTVFDGVKVRIYTPNEQTSDAGVVFIHGGGFCVGTLDIYDELCRKVSFDMGSTVISIDYRLAPKHPFPAGVEDCVTATKHFLKTASQYGVDAQKVAVMGDSAGGNLSAVVALVLRDEKFTPALKAQALIYPVTQGLDLSLPSYQQNYKGPILTSGMMAAFYAQYAAGIEGGTYDATEKFVHSKHVTTEVKMNMAKTKLDRSILPKEFQPTKPNQKESSPGDAILWNKIKDAILDQRFSPLLADDFSSLPAAFVFTAQYDVLRDEGIMYAQRLRQAGNDVTWCHSDTGYHGCISLLNIKNQVETRRQYEKIIMFMKEKLV